MSGSIWDAFTAPFEPITYPPPPPAPTAVLTPITEIPSARFGQAGASVLPTYRPAASGQVVTPRPARPGSTPLAVDASLASTGILDTLARGAQALGGLFPPVTVQQAPAPPPAGMSTATMIGLGVAAIAAVVGLVLLVR